MVPIKEEGGLCEPVKSRERKGMKGKAIHWNQAYDVRKSLITQLDRKYHPLWPTHQTF